MFVDCEARQMQPVSIAAGKEDLAGCAVALLKVNGPFSGSLAEEAVAF